MGDRAKYATTLVLAASGLSVCLLWLGVDGYGRQVALRTLGLGLSAGLVSVPLGLLITWVCRSRSLFSDGLVLTCIGLVFVPLFLQVSAWDSAFGKLGWFSTQGDSLQPLLTGWAAAVWIHGVAAAPQVALIMMVGLMMGGRSWEEQAMLDATPSIVFWNVTARKLLPLIMIGFVWTLVVTAREIAVTDIFQIGTLAEQIYLGYSLGQFNPGLSPWSAEDIARAESTRWQLAVALVFWVVVVFVVACFSYLRPYFNSDHWMKDQKSFGPMTWPKLCVGLLLWCGIALVPLGNLLVRASFGVERIAGEPVPDYSLSQLGRSVQRVFTEYNVEMQWSLSIALVSAAVLMVVAIGFCWLAIENLKWRIAFVLCVALLASIPGPLLGVGVVSLCSSYDYDWLAYLYDRTIFPTVLATALFCWPLVALITYCVLAGTAKDALEHANVEGAGQLSRLIRIAVLQNWMAVVGCFLIAFVLSFGELSASQMVLPAGIDTVPRRMLGLLHSGVNELTAAFSLVNFLLVFMLAIISWVLIRRADRSNA